MKYIPVTHADREEWLKWRQNGIGSSDVPVIMGVSRYKELPQLFKEKVNPVVVEDQSNEYIKARGNKIEGAVREFYAQHMGVEFNTLSCTDKEYSHRLATLDGIDSGCNLLIEIKLLTSQKEEKPNMDAAGFIKWMAAKENGHIPIDYYPQIQHQLSVTGAPVCMFIGYKEVRYADRQPRPVTLDDLAIVSVLPDPEYIKLMNEKIDEFWKRVLHERKKHEDTNSNNT